MSFFRPSTHPRALTGHVTAGLFRDNGRGFKVRVRCGADVARAAGVAAGERAELQWGVGEDAGCVLLRSAGRGPKMRGTLRTETGTLEGNFGRVPSAPVRDADGRAWVLPRDPRPAERCDWRPYAGGGVLVVLPRAWWSVEAPSGASPETRRRLAAIAGAPLAIVGGRR